MAPPRCCSRDTCCTCFVLFCILMAIVGFLALIFFFTGVFDPLPPDYSIDSISVKNFNVSSPTSEFDVTFRADNPESAGIHYLPGSSVGVFHNYVRVWTGALPVFLQERRNVTFFTVTLREAARTDLTRGGLVREASRGAPVVLSLAMRIKMRSNSWRSWKIKVPVDCYLKVDKIFTDAKIRANECYS